MRVAIWSAVSTKAQAAEDKASIKTQLELGRKYIRDGNHTPAGEYIVPGESRTAYISLSHAEAEIPQLKKLLDDAASGKYDLLWLYDLNRPRQRLTLLHPRSRPNQKTRPPSHPHLAGVVPGCPSQWSPRNINTQEARSSDRPPLYKKSPPRWRAFFINYYPISKLLSNSFRRT